MADVFGVSAADIGDDASIDTIDAWDSLKHLNLVLALEERFSISFTEQETVEILNYEIIRTVLGDHGVELAT
jgi:acyl carrier protein